MTKFKQFGKLPGRPSELIRFDINQRISHFLWHPDEDPARRAVDLFKRGSLKEGFKILGLRFPRSLKANVHVDFDNFALEMLDMARQLEERGF